jgi:hypothetical protein
VDAGSHPLTKVSNVAVSKQCLQEVLSRAGLGGQSCESEVPSHEAAVVAIFDGHFVFDFETISARGFSISSFALSLSFTHLYLLLAQSDTFYDLHALIFVGLRVLLICSFKNCVIFRAVACG